MSLGHRRTVLLTGTDRHRSARVRAQGLAAAAAGHPEANLIHRGVELNEDDGERTLRELLAQVGRVDLPVVYVPRASAMPPPP